MNFKIEASADAKSSLVNIFNEGGIELYEFKVVYENEQIPDEIRLTFSIANSNLNRIRFGMCFSRNNSPKILAISAYYCEFSALLNVKIPIPKSF